MKLNHTLKLIPGLLFNMFASFALAAALPDALSLRHFDAFRNGSGDSFLLLLMGMEDGFGTANVALIVERKKPLYCQPEGLALNPQNTLRILDEEVKRTNRGPDAPLSLVLLDGLKRTFPCR